VSVPAADVFNNNACNVLQVYRSYRRDVTLLTDLVRCAVRFATPKDLLNFVENWLFIYGEPQRPEKKPSMKKRFEQQFREFKDVVHDFFHPYSDFEDDGSPADAASRASFPPNSERTDTLANGISVNTIPSNSEHEHQAHAPGARAHNEQDVDCDCDDCVNSQRQHKIFEILRIRNRLDPALLDVPGGYRDLALKIKIGFFRWI
jgi:hypothetical protein